MMSFRFKSLVVFSIVIAAGLVFFGCNEKSNWKLEIEAEAYPRTATPVVFTLPAELSGEGELSLQNVESGSHLPVQRQEGRTAVFILDETLPAGEKRIYTLHKGKQLQDKNRVNLLEADGKITFQVGGKPVLTYNTSTLFPPEGLPDYYKRSGFIHPVYSPDGMVITDDFPVGHTHQHGLFFAWVNTTYRGDFTDFWNQQKETGTVEFSSLDNTASGLVYAEIATRQHHLSLKHGLVLVENWNVRVYDLPDIYLFDLESDHQIEGSDTLFINEYHYGGLGIRGSAWWNEEDSLHFTGPMKVLTSEGKTRPEANHSRPVWAAMYGPTEKGTAGVVVFDHPDNFRFPQPVRVHPEMPYFCFAPMVLDSFFLLPGRIYNSKYRIATFQGEPDKEQLDRLWQDYAFPPNVSLISTKGN